LKQQPALPNLLDPLIGNVPTQSRCYNQQQPEPRKLFTSSSSRTRQFFENTSDSMDLTQQIFDSDTEKFFSSANMTDPSKKIDALSQVLLPIGLRSSIKTESPASFDSEYSTVFGQEFNNQKIPIPEQRSKKRQYLHSFQKCLKIPNDCFYTLEYCQVCPKTHRAQSFSSLLSNYKVHLIRKHPQKKTKTKTILNFEK